MARGYKLRGEAFEFEIIGLKELNDMLDKLPKAMKKAVLTRALKTAAAPILAEAKQNVPRKTGNLEKHLIINTTLKASQRKKRGRVAGTAEVFIGSSSPHAHLVEWGTGPREYPEPRKVKIGNNWAVVTQTGQMPANPFLRRAWEATKGKAQEILSAEIWKELVKAARGLRKRAEAGKLGKRAVRDLLE
jgi:HK97 gp10 family phage protein